jgi:hypothetical protein
MVSSTIYSFSITSKIGWFCGRSYISLFYLQVFDALICVLSPCADLNYLLHWGQVEFIVNIVVDFCVVF